MELATASARLTLRVAGISAKLRLLSLSAEEALAELPQVTVIVVSTDELPPLSDWLGKDTEITLRGRYDQRYFHGAICDARRLQDIGRFQRMQVTVAAHAWWLTRRSRYRIYTAKSTPDIAHKLWREAGLRLDDLVLDLKQTPPVWQYRTQAGESDWDFLCRLFAELGCVWFFRHSEGRHQLVVTDHEGAWPCPETEALAAHYDHQSGQPEVLYRLRRQRCRTVRKSRVQRYRARQAERYETDEARADTPGTGRHETFFVHHQDAPEAAITSDARLRAQTAEQDLLTAQGNRLDLACGEVRTLIQPDGKRSQWLITGLAQQIHQPQVLEELAQGSWQHYQTVTGVPADTPWRPMPRPRPVIHGYWPAVVTGPEKGRVHTDGKGAVRIRFAWDPEGSEGTWIRVSQRLAGNQWGALALPRVGDEVSVHFIEGHPDTPVVCGRRYHAAHAAPQPLPDGKHQWMFRSRSGDTAGHEALIDDGEQPAVMLHSSGTLTEHTLRNRHEEGGGNRHQKIAADVARSTGGGLSLRADGVIEESVDQGIHLSADQALVLSGDTVTADAGSTIQLKAGSAVVNAGQTVIFKVGGSAVSVGPGGVSLSAPSVMINMGGGGGSASAASKASPSQAPEVTQHPGARQTVPAQDLSTQDDAAKVIGLEEAGARSSAKPAESKRTTDAGTHTMPPAARVIPAAAALAGAMAPGSSKSTPSAAQPDQAKEPNTASANQEAGTRTADEIETYSVTADASGPRLPENGLYELVDTSGNKLAETPAEQIYLKEKTVHIPFEGKVPTVPALLFWTDGEEAGSRVLVRKVAEREFKQLQKQAAGAESNNTGSKGESTVSNGTDEVAAPESGIGAANEDANTPKLTDSLESVFDAHEKKSINDCADYVIDVGKALGIQFFKQLDHATVNADGLLARLDNAYPALQLSDKERIVRLVDDGEMVIMGVTSADAGKAHGHVAIVRPEKWSPSGKWQSDVPFIAHRVLGGTPSLKQKASFGFSARYKSKIRFYHVKHT